MLHHDQQPSPSSSFSPLINRDSLTPPSGSLSPSSSASSSSRVNELVDEQGHVSEQEEHEQQRPEMEPQNNGGIYIQGVVFGFVEGTLMRDDTCSCVIVTFMFWIFVSMTMILGVFGPVNFSLGPNCSYRIHPNALFLQSVKVEELDDNSHGLTLYGFYESPPLDVVKTWTETQNYTVPSESHLESVYFLNKGSQINISYHVNPPGSFVYLVISQGSDSFYQWINDPSYPNYTLSWNIIEGTGIVQQNISQSSSYYVAVGNTNSGEVEVQLNLSVKSTLYNTTEAYYKCTFIHGVCTLRIFPTGNSLLLTSPDATMGLHNDWNVKLSYGPRWATYIIGIVVMNVVMLTVTDLLKKLRCIHHEETAARFQRVEDQAAPLLTHKDDDDLSSWGSCYDSGSNDEKAFEELLAAGCTEGKLLSLEDGENGNNTRRLCAICFDGPRDSFFLPCGHCVACFACGDRIAEVAGTCPICRRNIKKVRKIFMV